jgi:hypothetical protein
MGDYAKKPKSYKRGRCLAFEQEQREAGYKFRGSEPCRQPFPCLANVFVLAGTEGACDVCAPHLPKMREIGGWSERDGFYFSDGITPDQQEMVRAAVQQRIDEADELAAHESMYGHEDRELQLQRHGDECDCDDCDAARSYLRDMQL